MALTIVSSFRPMIVSADGSSPVRRLWQTPSEGCLPYGTPESMRTSSLQYVPESGPTTWIQDVQLWHSEPGEYNAHKLVIAGGRVLVVEATIWALDEQTGEKKWELRPDDNALLGRAIIYGDVLYFGTSCHRIYAVRVSDGKMNL